MPPISPLEEELELELDELLDDEELELLELLEDELELLEDEELELELLDDDASPPGEPPLDDPPQAANATDTRPTAAVRQKGSVLGTKSCSVIFFPYKNACVNRARIQPLRYSRALSAET